MISDGVSVIIFLYLYAHVQGLRIRAGRPIHEMGTSVLLIFLTERGLTAMRNRPTFSRTQKRIIELFLASCGCEAFETAYLIRDG